MYTNYEDVVSSFDEQYGISACVALDEILSTLADEIDDKDAVIESTTNTLHRTATNYNGVKSTINTALNDFAEYVGQNELDRDDIMPATLSFVDAIAAIFGEVKVFKPDTVDVVYSANRLLEEVKCMLESIEDLKSDIEDALDNIQTNYDVEQQVSDLQDLSNSAAQYGAASSSTCNALYYACEEYIDAS